jgi:hypothetical protein
MVAYDVNSDMSFHLFQPLDTWVHLVVQSHVTIDQRLLADTLLSDTGIAVASVACLICCGLITARKPLMGLATTTVMLLLDFFGVCTPLIWVEF